jgi:23S rRNA pseudouridine1911/1915/1917 synthase
LTEVGAENAGQRLDRFLAAHLEIARNQVQNWIRIGRVTVNNRNAKVSRLLETGDRIAWNPPSRTAAHDLEPEPGELTILHLDDDILVLNKPAGLIVHPGAGRETGTLVHRLLDRFPEIAETGGTNRPGIVHRLDKDTTGAMVVARSTRAYEALSTAFANRRVDKKYLAIVYGAPKSDFGDITLAIGRHTQKRKEMTVRPDGKAARTQYNVVAESSGVSLIEIDLETGRTHQIRVHMKAIGHPLVGDPVYGEARWKGLPREYQSHFRSFDRPALHAWKLRFEHPATGEVVHFEAAPAADLVDLWSRISGTAFPTCDDSSD